MFYEKYLELHRPESGVMRNTGASLFQDYQNLMRVWTHPWMFKLEEKRKEKQVKLTEHQTVLTFDMFCINTLLFSLYYFSCFHYASIYFICNILFLQAISEMIDDEINFFTSSEESFESDASDNEDNTADNTTADDSENSVDDSENSADASHDKSGSDSDVHIHSERASRSRANKGSTQKSKTHKNKNRKVTADKSPTRETRAVKSTGHDSKSDKSPARATRTNKGSANKSESSVLNTVNSINSSHKNKTESKVKKSSTESGKKTKATHLKCTDMDKSCLDSSRKSRSAKTVLTYAELSDHEAIIDISSESSEELKNENDSSDSHNYTKDQRRRKVLHKHKRKNIVKHKGVGSRNTRTIRSSPKLSKCDISSEESESECESSTRKLNGHVRHRRVLKSTRNSAVSKDRSSGDKNFVKTKVKDKSLNMNGHDTDSDVPSKCDNKDIKPLSVKDSKSVKHRRRSSKIRPKENLDDPLNLQGKVIAGEIIKEWKSTTRGKHSM